MSDFNFRYVHNLDPNCEGRLNQQELERVYKIMDFLIDKKLIPKSQ